MGNVIARDFKAASIGVILAEEFKDAEVLTKIERILKEADRQFAGEEKIFKTGLTVVRALNAEIMQRDMRLMGFLNIKLDMITTMLSSIMIGVGVDYTIHFLWRYKEERKLYSQEEAVIKTLTTSGRGISFNAFSVIIGFSVLFISGFLPVKFFAFLVTVSIAVCLVGALVLLTALIIIFEPDFLKK